MSTAYITENFLLDTESARRLFFEHADGLPIVDYHSHLPPYQIAANHRFANLTQIWLDGDHYKWRAMRTNGVDERYCTGDADDREKFDRWATTVPKLLRNQLYPWTHLELSRVFGISDRLLDPESAQGIWDHCNERLGEPELSARGILEGMDVRVACTTDDPVDSLALHRQIEDDVTFAVRVLPTWRPDRALAVDDSDSFNSWTDRLQAAAGVDVATLQDFLDALRRRHDAFHDAGCRLSDHGLETVWAEPYTSSGVAATFERARAGRQVGAEEADRFRSFLLYELAVMDHERDWAQQYHLGAMRNNNSRMFELLGPDSGYDSMGERSYLQPLAKLFDRLDSAGSLARTIVYNIHPGDNESLISLLGCFQDGSVAGKMQLGSGWWFNDQRDGMERQIEALSQNGLLSHFVGMLSDSRSFMSFPRHEYFRRLLCNLLGNDIERGLLPNDLDLVGGLVEDVCCNNAFRYFGFGAVGPAGGGRSGRSGRSERRGSR